MRNDEKTDKQGQNRGAFVSGFRSRWSSRRSQTEVLAWLCDTEPGPEELGEAAPSRQKTGLPGGKQGGKGEGPIP